ncbi:MAG: hypothetical protein KDK27_10880 [Leptospiraceae bacterium]|nr:hypothetical protein [Leptospiraceae bacterium]
MVRKKTGKNQTKVSEEFVDETHDAVSVGFYELIEQQGTMSDQDYERALKKLILKDPHYFDPYLALTEFYLGNEQDLAADQLLDRAYGILLEKFTGEGEAWPHRMQWGWLENRHILRLMAQKAEILWMKEERTIALDVYRRILKMNPGDNQGIRMNILALRSGMSFAEFMEMCEKEDWQALDEWFARGQKKFSHEFEILKEGGFGL